MVYGSDGPPPADVEKSILRFLSESRWPNPSVFFRQRNATTVTGKSGVKMTGPYEYVSTGLLAGRHASRRGVCYNPKRARGPRFRRSRGVKDLFADHLWPIDDVWNYHAAVNDLPQSTFSAMAKQALRNGHFRSKI